MTLFWLNRTLLRRKISDAVTVLAQSHPEVKKIVLFGSVAEDRAVPGSDVDILIIVEKVSGGFLDRPIPYQDYFRDIGLSTDMFVYTEKEMTSGSIPLLRTALAKGRVLFDK